MEEEEGESRDEAITFYWWANSEDVVDSHLPVLFIIWHNFEMPVRKRDLPFVLLPILKHYEFQRK